MPLAMHARVIEEIAQRGGIGLDGIEVQLEDGGGFSGSGLCGYTHPSGGIIILFPDAFRDEETLVRTLAHERTHAYQARIFGEVNDSIEAAQRERAALSAEENWWQFYRDKH